MWQKSDFKKNRSLKKFRSQYKAIKLGKKVLKVAAHFTSQDCSACGTRVKKSLSTRTHSCPECGYTANRDLNAAQIILGLGMQSLGVNP